MKLTQYVNIIFALSLFAVHCDVQSNELPNVTSYTKSNRYDIALFTRLDNDSQKHQIWQKSLDSPSEKTLAKQVNLGPKGFNYKDPVLSAEGQTLYFSSDQPVTINDVTSDFNIWQAQLTAQGWRNIQLVKFAANSPFDDTAPFLLGQQLFFTSNRDGYQAIYQVAADEHQASLYQSLIKHNVARSHLVFSPDIELAFFIERHIDSQTTSLQIQQKLKGNWLTAQPLELGNLLDVEMVSLNISPEGQWLYLGVKDKRNIYKVMTIATKDIVPPKLYRQHLAAKPISPLAARPVMESILSFSFKFHLTYGENISHDEISMTFSPFNITRRVAGKTYWTDGNLGYQMGEHGVKTSLSQDEIDRSMRIANNNFIYLFKQPDTEFFQQHASSNERGRLFRVHGKHVTPYSVLLSADNLRILQLRYDNLAVGIEENYQRFSNIWWPMDFAYVENGKQVASGKFSKVEFQLK